MKSKWKYWRKGDRIRIVCGRDVKMVLPNDAEKTYNAMVQYFATKIVAENATNSTQETKDKSSQKCGYDLLNEYNGNTKHI